MSVLPAQPRSSSALLRRVVDSLADGVVVVGLDGRCLVSNAAARALLGTDFAGVSAAEWSSTFGWLLPDMVTPCPPEDMPLARTLRGETVSDLELFMVNLWKPQGVWLSVNGTPLRDPHGEQEGGVVVLRDITRVKRKVRQVELLSNVVETTADAVIVTDRGGRIEYTNPAFETATGYAKAEVLGRNPSFLKSGVHGDEFYAGLWRTLLDGQVFRGTFVNRKKSGEIFFTEQTITPIRSPAGALTHVVSVGKDVTQHRRAAERESSLLLARSVQQRLFPASQPTVPGFDIHGATFVADVTGGDYFDFLELPNERLGIVVADVSGHGVDSALLMAETRAVLRATAQTTFEPSEILAVVNRVLHADTEPHRFATLLLAILHVPSRTLVYSSAGHTPGYLLDGAGAPRAVLGATGVPLGLFPGSGYETCPPLRMEHGETLLLVTDGVTECGVPEEEFFGIERAVQVVRSSRGERSSEVVEGLRRAVRAFEKGGPQRDDVTAVVVRCLAD